jgi:putative mRNA 3-end processing factor
MVRWLQQNGLEAGAFETEYGDEDDAAPAAPHQAQAVEQEQPANA